MFIIKYIIYETQHFLSSVALTLDLYMSSKAKGRDVDWKIICDSFLVFHRNISHIKHAPFLR